MGYLVTTGCDDALPSQMISDADCLKLNVKCSNLKDLSQCSKELKDALGSSNDANNCKGALGRENRKKDVSYFCRESCDVCGRLFRKYINLFDDS